MKSVRWLGAAIAAVLLVLAGCTTPSANTAATVNNQQIPVESVNATVQAIGGTTAEEGALADAHATVCRTRSAVRSPAPLPRSRTFS